MSKNIDYDALRMRKRRTPRRLAPLLFDSFYPLLIALFLIVAALWLGYLKPEDLNLQQPLHHFMQSWLSYMR